MVTGGHGTDVKVVPLKPKRVQTQGEEIANSISHGTGLIAALVGTPFLVMHAVRRGDAGFIVGTSIFSASMILLYPPTPIPTIKKGSYVTIGHI